VCHRPDITYSIYSDAHPSRINHINCVLFIGHVSQAPHGYINYLWSRKYFDCARRMDFFWWRHHFDCAHRMDFLWWRNYFDCARRMDFLWWRN
jgi:hypothetical protein